MIEISIDPYMVDRMTRLTSLIGKTQIESADLRRAITSTEDLLRRLKGFVPVDPDVKEKRMQGLRRRRRSKPDGDGYVLPEDMGSTGE